MNSDVKKGRKGGLLSLLSALVLGGAYFTSSSTGKSGLIILVLTVFLFGLGVISLAWPETWGVVIQEFLQQIGENSEASESDQEINIQGDNYGNLSNASDSLVEQSNEVWTENSENN